MAGRSLKLVLLLIAGLAANLCSCRPDPPPGNPKGAEPPKIPEIVKYCAPARLNAASLRVQVLIDGSGSMAGFRPYITQLSAWASHALSSIRNAGTTFESYRTCFFRSRDGITACSTAGISALAFRGDTNLHEAIASANSYDLSIILTDGVAATGTGTGDCAGGVDSACVGRAISKALAPRAGDPQTTIAGAWLLPLVALFDGPLYTEQAASALLPSVIEQNVSSETATTARVGKGSQDARGAMVFPYAGPKEMFSLVIARDADVGRAAVAALVSTAGSQLIPTLTSLKEFQRGIALLRPIELYPGYVQPLEPGAPGIETREGTFSGGTVDVTSVASGIVAFSCPAGDNSARIGIPFSAETRIAGCIDLMVLPPRKTRFSTAAGVDRIKDPEWTENLARLTATVMCDEKWRQPCDRSAPTVTALSIADFASAADSLNAPQKFEVAKLVAVLSTNNMAEQPHRIFGLKETLEKFYRELESQKVSLPFARVAFCRE
jgi:hypothetical protein